MAEKEEEAQRRKGRGGLPGDWPAEKEGKLEWTEQDRAGEGDGQTADRNGQTDGKGRCNDKDQGKNPADVRQTRGAGEERQKEKRKRRGVNEMRWGSRGRTDRLKASGESIRRTDRWQGREGALGCLHSAVFTS